MSVRTTPRGASRDPADDRQAADHAFLPGPDLRPDLDVGRDERLGGDVADIAEILDQPSFDGRLERRLDQSIEELRERTFTEGFESTVCFGHGGGFQKDEVRREASSRRASYDR